MSKIMRKRGRPENPHPLERVLFVRTDETTVDRVNAAAERRRKPGGKFSVADTLRELIGEALDRDERKK